MQAILLHLTHGDYPQQAIKSVYTLGNTLANTDTDRFKRVDQKSCP